MCIEIIRMTGRVEFRVNVCPSVNPSVCSSIRASNNLSKNLYFEEFYLVQLGTSLSCHTEEVGIADADRIIAMPINCR